MSRTILAAAALTVCVAGCTLAPKYTRPAAPVPRGWPAGPAYEKARPSADLSRAEELDWQRFFTDERLKRVIRAALENNRDLRLAALNVELARAVYGIRKVELFPSAAAEVGAARQRSSADLAGPGESRTTEQFSVSGGIFSWEIDFFGRIRSLKERALEEYLATQQARRGAQVLLVSAVAEAYLGLAADRENLALAEQTLATEEAAYELVKRRRAVGVATDLDVRRAQTTVDTARREVARYTRLCAQDENALALLAGSPVPAELLPSCLDEVSSPREISAGLSSEILLSRPDVLQAEELLKAADADIGAARAAFFPRIALTTTLGTASRELSGLFRPGSGTWSFSTQAVMPLFDARTWSALEASKVQRRIAVAQYEKTIQTAFREVADALALQGTIDRQAAAQQALVEALAETLRLSNARFEKGIESYLGVLDARRSLFAARQELVALKLARVSSRVRLFAVLGGGKEKAPPLGTQAPPAP